MSTAPDRPAALGRPHVIEHAMAALAPFLMVGVVMVVFYIIAPDRPLTLPIMRTILVHMVIVGICALGMTIIIISNGIDLSIGSAVALCSVSIALALRAGWPLWAGIAAAVLTGAACGLYNGLLITLLRLPPFIATLGTLGFYRGLSKWFTDSMPVSAETHGLEQIVRPAPPSPAWIVSPGVWALAALAIVVAVVLRYTIFGRYAFAIGSNEATARLCGIRVERMKTLIYVVAGLFTGLAGVMMFGRLGQGDPTTAIGLELEVIAAVVIGGGSLSGGQGGVAGTLAGAFLMAYLKNRCTALELSNYVQDILVGHIIIVA
ncbi:MAG: ABC transporter permease, partial [Phycisphaerales bacterium]|nr:ABC transporter permease [Phycisphaerales bacterium]